MVSADKLLTSKVVNWLNLQSSVFKLVNDLIPLKLVITTALKSRDSTRMSNSFGAYFLKFSVDWKPLITSIIPKVTQGKLLEIKVPVPPVDFQQSVVARLTALESKIVAEETFQRNTEDNARFILESYLGAKATEVAETSLITSEDIEDSDDTISHA